MENCTNNNNIHSETINSIMFRNSGLNIESINFGHLLHSQANWLSFWFSLSLTFSVSFSIPKPENWLTTTTGATTIITNFSFRFFTRFFFLCNLHSMHAIMFRQTAAIVTRKRKQENWSICIKWSDNKPK